MRFINAGLIACALAALPAHGATIFSENFDELTAALGVTSAGGFQAVGGTNVDIVGAGDGFGALCAGPESGNCIDLDGTGGNSQGVLQTVNPITLVAGTNYFLSFDLIGSQRGVSTSTTVTLGSFSQTFTLASGDDTDGIVVNALVTGSGPANLTFTSNTPGAEGAILDNVLITTTPEPSTMILMGSALLGLGLVARRRATRV